MAVPPTYVDLGKSAKDVFTKGYGKQQRANHTQLFHQPLQQCDIEEKGLNRKLNMMCAAIREWQLYYEGDSEMTSISQNGPL